MKNRIFINYLIYIFFYTKWKDVFYFYNKIIFEKINYKFLKIPHYHYPQKVKEKIYHINSTKKFYNRKCKKIENLKIPQGCNEFKLASGYYKFNNSPDWKKIFDDNEQTESLHRWNWLLYAITDNHKIDYEWGLTLVRSYLSEMSPISPGLASESYTVGERISNLCLFSRHFKKQWGEFPSEINDSIQDMLHYLSNNLEYFSGDLTGNHIVNNARALILGGYSINDNVYLDLGISILKNQLPKLIDKDGFMREGSSHYQFLFTRWILELCMISKEKKNESLLKIIEVYISKLLNACNFFLVKSQNNDLQMVLIGDVSPDCTPDWILDLPFSPLAQIYQKNYKKDLSGWAKLFSDFKDTNKVKVNNYQNTIIQNNRHWSRIEYKNLICIFHHEAFQNNDPIASHAHDDFLSFVLFHNGEEILIDTGRKDYGSSSKLFTSNSYHSTVTLNDKSAMYQRNKKIYYPEYLKREYFLKCERKFDKVSFEIEHNGFSLKNLQKIIHKRKIILKDKTVDIVDEINGNGKYKINYFYQFSGNDSYFEKSKDDFVQDQFTLPHIGISFKKIFNEKKIIPNIFYGNKKPRLGWRSLQYGTESKAITCLFSLKRSLPIKSKFTISFTDL